MKDLLYFISKDNHDSKSLKELLNNHTEIRFVSLMGIDIGGNATDEKIPIKVMLDDIENFLNYGIQTDGSSVVLHEITTLNNARVDLLPDLNVNWFVDYNFDHIIDNLPIGTLKIPSFLIHNSLKVDSRSVLVRSIDNFENKLLDIFKSNPYLIKNIGIESVDEIEKIILTSATELEFWVKTPNDKADLEKLSTSQTLKEQYWKKTIGIVRTALEKTLMSMQEYGLEPEMGHKEVGGITSKIGINRKQNYIMEQLEIDWKYDTALQAADNEIIVRELIEDTFRSYGLEVTFEAKPLEGVAGNGEHTHVGVSVKLKDGKVKNLFSPSDMKKDYLSEIGYGALMGILKNYEVINPFITSSNDSFNRLKPGFEAPVCIVTSLGTDVNTPSRNRSILAGLVRDIDNPLATRFEVRSPNPFSNTYLVLTTIYQGMLDGIKAVSDSNKTTKELEKEISKNVGDESFYLERDRVYRSEDDVFEHYTESERNAIFAKPPSTVWENIKNLIEYKDKRKVLLDGNVLTDKIIDSFIASTLDKWIIEIKGRLLNDNIGFIRECKKLHDSDEYTDVDVVRWEKINSLRLYLMKNSLDNKCLFTRLKEALDNKDFDLASSLQLEINEKIKELSILYTRYKRNLF